MKKIDIKKLPQKLLDEGITPGLCLAIQEVDKITDVILEPAGKTQRLIPAKQDSFWILHDKGGKAVVNILADKVSIKDALIGRARYILRYWDSHFEEQVDKKYKALCENMSKVVQDSERAFDTFKNSCFPPEFSVDLMKVVYQEQFGIGAEAMVQNELRIKAQQFEEKKGWQDVVIQLRKWLDAGDFDSLYIALYQEGVPRLLSLQVESKAVPLIYGNRIFEMVDSLQNNGHLKTVIRMDLAKKYLEAGFPTEFLKNAYGNN